MALPALTLSVIRGLTERIPAPAAGLRRAISFGYPDILASEDQLFDLFGNDVSRELRFRPDSDAILRWHNATAMADRVVESRHFFSLIGYDLTIADIAPIRGDEIIIDLNEAVDAAFTDPGYDLVIDGGTAEHCFNIGQAFKNFAHLTRVGGFVFHLNPASMFNHGFYNLNPTMYADFYAANGFEVEFLKAAANMMATPQVVDVPAHARFNHLPANATLICAARRLVRQPITWPMQAKYRLNPTQTA